LTSHHSTAEDTVADVVADTLRAGGVTHVFGVVGSGNYRFTSRLVRNGAAFVAARHEGAAITMADAFGRISGEVAVCSVHQGPGFTNTLTGLTDAAKNGTPLIVLAAQATDGPARTNFAIDQTALARTCGATAERVWSAASAAADTRRALARTVHERKPVVLNMPLDVQALPASPDIAPAEAPQRSGTSQRIGRPRAAAEDVAHLHGLLARARRPLLVAGHGAPAGVRDALLRLAAAHHALVATTALAKDYFGRAEASLGILGGFSSAAVAEAVATSDLVVGFGASFTPWTTRQGTAVSPGVPVVQVDDRPDPAALWDRVTIVVAGDVATTVDDLLSRCEEAMSAGDPAWRVPALPRETVGGTGTLHPGALTARLEALLPPERTLVVDGGHFIGWPITGLRVPAPDAFVFTSAGFQSIGLGLGASVGAHLAAPHRLTVLATGDGGLLMASSELETLARLDLPVLVVVYDDEAYGAEVHHFGADGPGIDLVKLPAPDLCAIARGAGVPALRVTGVDDLDGISDWLTEPRGPLLLDCKIDPTVVGHWAEQDFAGH
jgi:acetolactate synthase I/II/III large subunit